MTSQTVDPATTAPTGRTRRLLPFNVALVLPAQLTMLAVVLAPTLIAIWLSLTDWQPTQGTAWYDAEFSWFWNFNDLWFDTRFINSLWRTALVVAVAVGFELVIALGLALLFLDEWPWRKLAVSVLILPMMIVPVDAANAFFMLFNDRGPINHLIGFVTGMNFQFSWLSDPDWALAPIVACEVWQWTPLMFLLLLTGLMNLPQNQIRAAQALGASQVRIFFRIMLPLLTPVILVALLIRSIETFKIFDAIYILTRGGPGASTETISMYMYNGAFVYFRIGYIAAAALVVLVLVVSICLALARPLKQHHG
ncbi:sugar ABC transporter permease [Hypericibacter adhaerens]|uniref:Sugar ABC transporter permease n=1 Tax=Hypericibacter adhaerens TaxID=2602016 RepID=A0A5J6N485_9PROT|nr:sugar ABC transporter permease [Hypericibacter adhaerens]QEX24234.1 sugar ABC transporter permease [Hypericibacter adhaerens]